EETQNKHNVIQTFDEFIKKMNLPWVQEIQFIRSSTDEEYEKCLDYLINQATKEEVCKIIKAHDFDNCNRKIPESILFQLINQHDDKTNEVIYDYLVYITSSKVEQLGLELLNTKYYIQGIIALINNYKKEYQELILKCYKRVKFSFKNASKTVHLEYTTLHFIEHQKKGCLDDILFYLYQNSYDSFYREWVFDCMKKRKLLTKELLQECIYDFNYEIQIKAKKMIEKI
ncbi:MAG: hypothetical protein K2O05_03950, partial [Anaeroplasmataceae bacterium]|nr:hypothetical protein [Anaeroplasmataceae bacterium]